ncbi:MAG: Hsp20/alpha crystallin family protein [Planctomycetes bacterium]|nr:Hsp20/alpha crystallin family protein [Planctomycetota bacterium]
MSPVTRGLVPGSLFSSTLAPFTTSFESVLRDLARGFESFAGEPFAAPRFPAINVRETETEYLVDVSVPGYSLDDLDVTVHGTTLKLVGRSIESEDDATSHRRERRRAAFERTLELPTAIDANRVVAELRNGVLHISLSKPEETQPRRIEVRSKGA